MESSLNRITECSTMPDLVQIYGFVWKKRGRVFSFPFSRALSRSRNLRQIGVLRHFVVNINVVKEGFPSIYLNVLTVPFFFKKKGKRSIAGSCICIGVLSTMSRYRWPSSRQPFIRLYLICTCVYLHTLVEKYFTAESSVHVLDRVILQYFAPDLSSW